MTDKQRPVVPPTEVRSKAKRRSASAEYKIRILAEVDACTKPDAVVAILEHLGLPARAPPVASARAPGWSVAA